MREGFVPSSKSGRDVGSLESAQDLIYDAWEVDGAQRVRLARKALDICDDCADAYVILAEGAGSLHEARVLYTEGVNAGARSIDPDAFQTGVGTFWLDLAKRPYMRALLGLAQSLWDLGKGEEAVSYASELIRLNPNDNQGVRYLLVNWLQVLGHREQLGTLMKAFADEMSALMAYPRALFEFSGDSGSDAADVVLDEAIDRNPSVPRYLLGLTGLPKSDPDMFSRGSEEEAIVYARLGKPAWKSVVGALDWLASRSVFRQS